jgi:hypothetical protein
MTQGNEDSFNVNGVSRTLVMLEKQVAAMVNCKIDRADDKELLRIARFLFGDDNELLENYQQAIDKEYGAPKIVSEPIVYMGKKAD